MMFGSADSSNLLPDKDIAMTSSRVKTRREPGRLARLRAACALAGTTMSAYAASLGISYTYLWRVATEDRTDKKYSEQIDAFIAKHRTAA